MAMTAVAAIGRPLLELDVESLAPTDVGTV